MSISLLIDYLIVNFRTGLIEPTHERDREFFARLQARYKDAQLPSNFVAYT